MPRPHLPVVAAVATALTLTACAGPSPVDVAAGFAPPATWEVTQDHVVGRSLLCLGGDPCPSLQRAWRTPAPPTNDELQALVTDAGWDATVDGDCTRPPSPETRGDEEVCSAEGAAEGYDVILTVRVANDDPDTHVILYVR